MSHTSLFKNILDWGMTKPSQQAPTKLAQRAPKLGQLERTEARVMSAVTELLGEVGYRQLSVDLIAERSGVGRATIYRRWKTIPTLAIAAFESALGPGLPAPDHGEVRTDLVHLYRRFAKILSNSLWGELLPSLIEANKNDPAFKGMLARLDRERRTNSITILERAQGRGQLPTDANLDWIIDALSGPLFYRFLVSGGRLSERGLVEWVVDSVLSQFGPSRD